jgi:hypothetical protein
MNKEKIGTVLLICAIIFLVIAWVILILQCVFLVVSFFDIINLIGGK